MVNVREQAMINAKISIIIPVWNAEKFLKRCINSILIQTYTNFELILIDDGSTDNSRTLCETYSAKDKRIVVIHQVNKGVAMARNNGLAIAKGDYVTFIDADDYVVADYLEKLFNALVTVDEVDLSVLNYYEVNSKNEFIKHTLDSSKFTGNIQYDYDKLQSILWAPWGKLYKMDIIRKHHIMFPSDLLIAEDQIFNFQYIYYINRCNFIDMYGYYYNQDNENSLIKNITSKKMKDDFIRLSSAKKFLQKKLIFNRNEIFMNCITGHISLFFRQEQTSDINYMNFCKTLKKLTILLTDMDYEGLKIKKKMILYCIKNSIPIVIYIYYRIKFRMIYNPKRIEER